MPDPDSSNILSKLFVLLILIMCNAFFAMSEMAVISLNDVKVRKLASEGNKRAVIIEKLISKPSSFLATIQVGVTLSNLLASAFAADSFSEYIVAAFAETAISASAVRTISIVVITCVLSYISLVFGELVPKRIAMHHYEKISFAIAPAITLIAGVTRPFVALLTFSANGILKFIGVSSEVSTEEVTEEEIRMMIDVGEQSGTIEQTEKDMINNIFEFDDMIVGDFMTHRTEITAIETDAPLSEAVATALQSGHSRIPIYEEDLDSIVGILYVKDLLKLLATETDERFSLKEYMRPPLYVPESARSATLLSEFKTRKIQIAVVVDEYGGTSGIVTMEDLLEKIVGNIQDEYDDEEEDITQVAENKYILDGLAPLEVVLDFFGIAGSDASDEYDTIGGYIVSLLGYIPGEKERPNVVIKNVRFTIKKMDERRVDKLFAEKLQAADENPNK